jgi:hypothetical protein
MSNKMTAIIQCLAVLCVVSGGYAFQAASRSGLHGTLVETAKIIPGRNPYTSLTMAKDEDRSDAVSRRRKRRGKESGVGTTISSPSAADNDASKERVVITPDSYSADTPISSMSDGTSSLEDTFGLGNNQLRELMEQELPVPREDLVTKKEVKEADGNKVFKLPDLNEFLESTTSADDKNKGDSQETKKIDRSNQDEYLRVIQLNPFADADDSMFLEEVRSLILSFFS